MISSPTLSMTLRDVVGRYGFCLDCLNCCLKKELLLNYPDGRLHLASFPHPGYHLLKNDDRSASVSCFSLCVSVLPVQSEEVSTPPLWKTVKAKQNILTGCREHEYRLKTNNSRMGLAFGRVWMTATVWHQYINPRGFETDK